MEDPAGLVLGNEIKQCKSVFRFGVKQGIIATLPAFGDEFSAPEAKLINRQKAAKVEAEGDEILRMLKAAPQPIKSWILLAINCGLGNSDILPVARLAQAMLDG